MDGISTVPPKPAAATAPLCRKTTPGCTVSATGSDCYISNLVARDVLRGLPLYFLLLATMSTNWGHSGSIRVSQTHGFGYRYAAGGGTRRAGLPAALLIFEGLCKATGPYRQPAGQERVGWGAPRAPRTMIPRCWNHRIASAGSATDDSTALTTRLAWAISRSRSIERLNITYCI